MSDTRPMPGNPELTQKVPDTGSTKQRSNGLYGRRLKEMQIGNIRWISNSPERMYATYKGYSCRVHEDRIYKGRYALSVDEIHGMYTFTESKYLSLTEASKDCERLIDEDEKRK